jgi:hypothetical protein
VARLFPLFLAVAVTSYVAAVVIALPLGTTGVVDPYYTMVPIAIGGIAIALAMLGEAAAYRRR